MVGITTFSHLLEQVRDKWTSPNITSLAERKKTMRMMIALASFAILSTFFFTIGSDVTGSDSQSLVNLDSDPSPTQIKLEPVLTGLDQPLYVTGAGDGTNRLFIVEQSGRIKVLLPDTSIPVLFLDITEKVLTGGESGLLGLAFHPQYKDNRRFFVSYSRNADGATCVAEYRVSESDPNSVEAEERLLLEIPQLSDIHHGGMIQFGLDNFLYVSTGDGFWEDPDNNAQNVEDLRGKMLRIDVDHTDGERPYSSPSSNPFFGDTPGRDEVYALGFRNPWRFSFDRLTGQIYVGDVGHEQQEEINVVTAGGNFGWHVFEGTRCTDFAPQECNSQQFISPLVEYDHTDGRCAVTGGYVYRGHRSSLPLGSYVFGDLCTGEIFLLNESTQEHLIDTDINIASFGEDENGEIYVVGLGGTVHRIIKNELLETGIRIDAVEVRHRSKVELLQPVTVQSNGKKYEAIIRGAGFAPGAEVFVGGRKMKSREITFSETELTARLRRSTLKKPGPLVIEVVNSDGTRSNGFEIELVLQPDQ
jgi:glucose/arabinose dehydrogenase